MTMAEAPGEVQLLTSCALAPCKELGETVGVCSPQHYGKGHRQILGAPGSVRQAERPAPGSARGLLSNKVVISNWTLAEWFLQRCDNRKNYSSVSTRR